MDRERDNREARASSVIPYDTLYRQIPSGAKSFEMTVVYAVYWVEFLARPANMRRLAFASR